MRTTEFLMFYLSRHCGEKTISNKLPNGVPYEVFSAFAEMTAYINYNCGFDDIGICKNNRNESVRPKNRCCCTACSNTTGYLRVIPNNVRQIREIAKCFNRKFGFWREGKGCILPRKYRSSVCLTHNCRQGESSFTDAERKLLSALKEGDILFKSVDKRRELKNEVCEAFKIGTPIMDYKTGEIITYSLIGV